MTQEALKLVMDALDNLLYWDNGKPEYDEARKALQVGKQALAQTQEPVAWTLADKVRQDLDRQACPDAFMRIAVESIVKHYPSQRTEQEPVGHRDGYWCADLTCKKCYSADFRFKHKNSVDKESLTIPPQRTWVGLTDDDVMEVWDKIKNGDWAIDFYDVIEAKLKEKNT